MFQLVMALSVFMVFGLPTEVAYANNPEETIVPIIELFAPPKSVTIKGTVILRRFNTEVLQDDTGAVYTRCPVPLNGNIDPQVGDVVIATGHYDGDSFIADKCEFAE